MSFERKDALCSCVLWVLNCIGLDGHAFLITDSSRSDAFKFILLPTTDILLGVQFGDFQNFQSDFVEMRRLVETPPSSEIVPPVFPLDRWN